ncbi:hypothetical protein [Halorientalis halophila]|uniref:hypothetical protein n=1 Tax=Halorientalis halophila TaxID=3108499 RepID=UPI00300B30DC
MTRSDEITTARAGQQPRTPRTLTRYDLVLALIPAVFLLSVVLAHFLGIPMRTALLGASSVGGLALLDALFVNPPTRPTG